MELKKLLLNRTVWGDVFFFFFAISEDPWGQHYSHNDVKPVFTFFPLYVDVCSSGVNLLVP